MLALNKVLEDVTEFLERRDADQKITFLSVAEARAEEVLFADELTEKHEGDHVDVKLVRALIQAINIAKESK
jgi:hypothetical protein